MEKFIDRIIETDRKAREIIEEAQSEKKLVLEQAQQKAKQQLAARAATERESMFLMDRECEKQKKIITEKADVDYIAAKHALDATFDAGHDTWLHEIVSHVSSTH